jgi:hypothetical protein
VEDGDVFFTIGNWGAPKDDEGIDFDCKESKDNEHAFEVRTYECGGWH